MNDFSDPPLMVLTSLASGPKHGHAMLEDIETLSGARLGPGTLYGAISRLESQGLIERLPSEDRRQPYRLTPGGAKALRARLTTMRRVAAVGIARLATL
jgi:DNA-binding PadR family transcriptional regulator